MVDINALSNSLAGLVSPFIVQLVNNKFLKWSDKAAHWLSLVIAAGCVVGAFLVSHTPFTVEAFSANLGVAFTLSQVIYHNLMGDSGKKDDSA